MAFCRKRADFIRVLDVVPAGLVLISVPKVPVAIPDFIRPDLGKPFIHEGFLLAF
jgi:hypothetical protein